MRVLAMSLKIVIILFIQIYHPSDGRAFRSVSTTLRSTAQITHRPTLEVWGGDLPTCSPTCTSYSQSGIYDTRLNGHHPIAVATSWTGTFRGKEIPPILQPPAHSRIVAVSLDMCGNSGSISYLKSASQNHTVLLCSWKECRWMTKTNFTYRLNPEN